MSPVASDTEDVAGRLRVLRQRIEDACARAARDPSGVRLVGASKRQPLERLRQAYDAGLRDFGENLVQEGEAKKPQLPEDIRWHLLGPLQSNKTRRAAEIFDLLQAVDRLKIARGLNRIGEQGGSPPPVFLEINVGAEASKHGFPADDLAAVRECLALPHLRVDGVMAIPPLADTPEGSRIWFKKLREIRDRLTDEAGERFGGFLSMGMSGDFEVAIEEGATHVRVGTALFGERPC